MRDGKGLPITSYGQIEVDVAYNTIVSRRHNTAHVLSALSTALQLPGEPRASGRVVQARPTPYHELRHRVNPIPCTAYTTSKAHAHCAPSSFALFSELIPAAGKLTKNLYRCAGRKGHFPDATIDPVIQIASMVMHDACQPWDDDRISHDGLES